MKIALLFLALAMSDVHCPLHEYAVCWWTGKTAPSGAQQYKCSCGDLVWSK